MAIHRTDVPGPIPRPVSVVLALVTLVGAALVIAFGPRPAARMFFHPGPVVELPHPRGLLTAVEPTFASFELTVTLNTWIHPGGRISLSQGHVLPWTVLGDDEVRYRLPPPQWTAPNEPNFLTLDAPDKLQRRLAWLNPGSEGSSLIVEFPFGAPPLTDITFRIGDTRFGSPGHLVPPYPLDLEWILAHDRNALGPFEVVPSTRRLRVVGQSADTFTLVTPSTPTGLTFPATLAVFQGTDRNDSNLIPVESWTGDVHLRANDGSPVTPTTVTFGPDDRGVKRFDLQLTKDTTTRITLHDAGGRKIGESTPMRIGSKDHALFWGSLQAHSALGGHGSGTPTQAFECARDLASLDFFALTEHASARAFDWPELKALAESFHDPGRFVTFAGYEWSHPTAGHRHVVLRTSTDKNAYSHLPPESKVHITFAPDLDSLAQGPGSDPDALLIPHHMARIGAPGTNRFEWGSPPPPRQLLAEVYSWHGSSDRFDPDHPLDGRLDRTFRPGYGSYVTEALAAGQFLGIIADGDQHFARPGLNVGVHRKRGSRLARHGLTAVWAPSLDRDSLFGALESRRCYGTTGARILVDFRCEDEMMGADVTVHAVPSFDIDIQGTARLAEITLYRNGTGEVARVRPDAPTWKGTLEDKGAASSGRALYTLHVLQEDGHRAWSSPIRVTVSP